MTQQIRIAVAGANGRMGKVLVEAVQQNPRTVLTGALEHAGSDALGLDAGYAIGQKTGVPISADMDAVLANCDVVIDFTRPDASLPLIAKCAEKNIKMVIGTTGYDDNGKAAIAAAAQKKRDCVRRQLQRGREPDLPYPGHGGTRAERRLRHRNH